MNTQDFARIARAIDFLDAHVAEQPDLARVAAEVGVSEHHFQRLFSRWAGVSPKRFLQFATARRAREHLTDGETALQTTFATGLSSPSRLHDLTVAVEAATPGEMKRGGEGLAIAWGVHPTPFGACLIAVTPRGICDLAFSEPDDLDDRLADLRARWPAASLREDAATTGDVVMRVFGGDYRADAPITVLLKGTNYQIQVWRALLEIPPGSVATYGAVARSLGMPRAARAVGGAIGANRVAFLIPCHRVIRATSAFGDYRWGASRKKAILAWEQALLAG